jgi:predicted ATPase
MRIECIRIQNFRSFKDETVRFNSYNCLVGANGSGKSTVLCALNVFFRETDNATTDLVSLDIEDFHRKETADPIEITVTFADLSEDAKRDFADYVRQEKLIVSAIAKFDPETKKADVKQYGQRMGMADFQEFFRALGDGKKVAELKEIYLQLRGKYGDLPAPGSKDAMIDALRAYETARQEQCVLIPSEDQFYGVSRGANRLAKYLQWIYVPAVKDASSEQVEARNSALGKLLARTVRAKTNFDERIKILRADVQGQYQKLLDENQEVLEDISASLQGKISEWAHPEATLKLEWRQDPEKSVQVQEPWAHIIAGEGDFEGALARFGHGLQRSYLLALLQELSGNADSSAPTLILGCEEPELYQHPPQARHLSAVLQNLATANSQVIISTHSPLFVSGEGFEDVRMVRRDRAQKRSTVTQVSFDDIATKIAAVTGEMPKKREGVQAKIHQALQPALSEMFFVSRLVLVEGLEDVAYITTYLNLLGKWDDYRKMGCHIVSVNGKSELLQPIVVAKHLGIPTYVIVDSDADKPDRNGSLAKHEKDNKALLSVFGRNDENPMPAVTLWGDGFVMWQSDIGAIASDEIGGADWAAFQQEADKLYGQAGNLRKNGLHIASSLLLAMDAGKKSASLERLISQILDQQSYV